MGNSGSSTPNDEGLAPAAAPVPGARSGTKARCAAEAHPTMHVNECFRIVSALRQFNKLIGSGGPAEAACTNPATTFSTAFDIASKYLGEDAATLRLTDVSQYAVLTSTAKAEPLLFLAGPGNLVSLATFLTLTPNDVRAHFDEAPDEFHAISAQIHVAGMAVTLDCTALEPRLTFANMVRTTSERAQAALVVEALALALSVYLLQRAVAASHGECYGADVKALFAAAPRLQLLACLDSGQIEQYDLRGDIAFWLGTPFSKRERGLGSYIGGCDGEPKRCPPTTPAQHAAGVTSAPGERRARDFSTLVQN